MPAPFLDSTLHEHLHALGASKTEYTYDKPSPALLEVFPNPFKSPSQGGARGTVHIEVPEFTSLCPMTGQPDFATIVIDYQPRALCVESKSLKLYLMSFRQHGEFHEACVNRIGNDLTELLSPYWLKIEGRFTPRGGIPFWPSWECGYVSNV